MHQHPLLLWANNLQSDEPFFAGAIAQQRFAEFMRIILMLSFYFQANKLPGEHGEKLEDILKV
jgi:hypothetical protein